MSPRRNRPTRRGRRGCGNCDRIDPERARRGVGAVESWNQQLWQVRQISAGGAVKTYRCPGCDHEIRPGTAHVVVWPTSELDGATQRRHWHTGCWRARDRRSPSPRRPR